MNLINNVLKRKPKTSPRGAQQAIGAVIAIMPSVILIAEMSKQMALGLLEDYEYLFWDDEGTRALALYRALVNQKEDWTEDDLYDYRSWDKFLFDRVDAEQERLDNYYKKVLT